MIVTGASIRPRGGDELGERDFSRLAALVEGHAGIRMPAAKRVMVEGRLRRRVRTLGLPSLHAYCRFLFEEGGLESEFPQLLDALTTNKTDFFREPQHFDVLIRQVVPEMVADGVGLHRPLRVWSAACSTGCEPYTIAMVLSEVAVDGFGFAIAATDICSEVLATARRAIYPEDVAAPIPLDMRRRYLLRARRPADRLVRIVPELRSSVGFGQINLLEPDHPWKQPMDVIFCRNVLIYFAKPTQQTVLRNLCRSLRPGGYLFVGHSEALGGLSLPLQAVGPSVYRRTP